MSGILTDLKNIYVAIRGFHTDRHLIVIESDDWGSIRMPSYGTFRHLQQCGDYPEKNAFLSNDCLETERDLRDLYKVLESVRDVKGNPAVITANFAMANPDFNKIEINTGKYAFEPFYATYEKYNENSNTFETIKEGIKDKVFFPQLHCREHMNVNRWMRAIQNNDDDAVLAFENKMIGVNASFSNKNVYGYMDAFNTDHTTIEELNSIVKDSAEMFAEVFGYKSKTIVPPCFVWPKELEATFSELGIVGIQSSPWQNYPLGRNGEYKLRRKIRYTGQTNKNNQIYTVRNCSYEPAYNHNPENSAQLCFEEICRSFKDRKPAVINSHRLNYIGSINPDNSKENLKGLELLLNKVKETFHDVEFINTVELVDIICGGKDE